MGYVYILIHWDLTERPKVVQMGEKGDQLKNG